MPLRELTEEERRVVHACLTCVGTGEVILHDWEFQTIMGIDVSELRSILDAWPDVDDSLEMVSLAINNSMNNLLGHPHAHHEDWDTVMPYSKEEVARVFTKWKGSNVGGYFDGLQ